MSLQVWLPLNGDLQNQGLSDISVTNNSATIDNGGKIGKCYVCSKNNAMSFPSFSWMTMKPQFDFSFFCWVKGTTTGWLIAAGGWELRLCPTYIRISLSTNGQYPAHYAATFDANTWYHLGFTWDGGNGSLKLYLNGTKVAESTVPSTADYNIGSTFGFPYDGTRYFNDLRVYDHCLSAKEVKELSKGLVLHYPLNNVEEVQKMNNTYTYPTFDTSDQNGGWNHWGGSGVSGSYSQNTSKEFIYNQSQTYSHKVINSASSPANYLIYKELRFSGGYRCMQAIIKESNGNEITDSICNPTWNGETALSTERRHWTSITHLGNGFYLCKVEGINQTTSPTSANNHLLGIGICPGYSIYISECYVEETKYCSNIFDNDSIGPIYDRSGLNYHGTCNSTAPKYSDDSPKYNGCYYFNRTSNYITTPALPTSGLANSYSISWWGKVPSYESIMFWGFSNGNRLNYYSGTYCNTGDGSGNPFYATGTTVISAPSVNEWHHFVMVGNGTSTLLYMDGELYGTAKTYKPITGTTMYINGWDNSTTYKCNGYISDFRIYATALSAEDIRELYNSPVSIANNGGLIIQGELEETNSSREVLPGVEAIYMTNGVGSITMSPEGAVFNGYVWGTSGYCEISPDGHTYEYDFVYDNTAGSMFYIGFEKYDADKTSTSNNSCVYIVSSTNGGTNVRLKGTIDLANVGNGKPTKYIKLRVLSNWKDDVTGAVAKIKSCSLREVSSPGSVNFNSNGIILGDVFRENGLGQLTIHSEGVIESSNFIEC